MDTPPWQRGDVHSERAGRFARYEVSQRKDKPLSPTGQGRMKEAGMWDNKVGLASAEPAMEAGGCHEPWKYPIWYPGTMTRELGGGARQWRPETRVKVGGEEGRTRNARRNKRMRKHGHIWN